MLSVHPSGNDHTRPHHGKFGSVDQPSCLRDALIPFKQMIVSSGQPFVRLHCTIPTFCSSSVNCLDLHDLHDLRSRSLLFLHDLLSSLRSAGVQATYHLAPSNSDLVIIRALSANIEGPMSSLEDSDGLNETHTLGKDKAILAVAEEGPIAIIT